MKIVIQQKCRLHPLKIRHNKTRIHYPPPLPPPPPPPPPPPLPPPLPLHLNQDLLYIDVV